MIEKTQKNPVEKTIGFRGTEEYRTSLKQAALNRGLPVQEMLERAVSAYLQTPGSRHEPAPKTPGKNLIEIPGSETAEWKAYRELFVPPENRRLLQMLYDILRSGVSDAIGAVTQNLEVFSKYVEGKPPGSGTAPDNRRRKR